MKKPQRLIPIEARTEKQICSLRMDNLDTKNFWILIDGTDVVLCEQTSGESPKGKLCIPRAQFDKLALWYVTGRVTR